jgi:hypothetical protein
MRNERQLAHELVLRRASQAMQHLRARETLWIMKADGNARSPAPQLAE